MARLEIEVAGDNKAFKSAVKDSMASLEELKRYAEGLEIKMFGASTSEELKSLEKSLASVSTALKSFTKDSQSAKTVNSTLSTSITELKVSEQELKNEYAQARAELTKYALEQRKLADSTRAETAATKQSEAAQRSVLAERRRGEAEARKLAAIIAKNRKQVEKESSEYYKLSTALGVLRKSAKDTLAEMFRLETQGKKGSAAYQELANKARGVVAQTNFLDAGLKKIDASLGLHQRNVGNYSSALSALSPQFSQLSSQLQMMGVDLEGLGSKGTAGFKQLGASIVNIGKNIGAFLLSPVGLAIVAFGSLVALFRGNAATVKAFDSGLLNVSKTTGIAGTELNQLSDSIIGLSRQLKTVSTGKLLEYATVAGQLGVKGSKNILNFSEALAKLETASDITGEAGGAEIARLLTLTDGGVQNVKAFGDEIVNLGNNFAATEKEILGNAESIAQNTGLYKVGRQEVLAYATATKSVGLEAEVVGSALFRTLAQIEGFSNGAKGADKILSLLGLTQKELNTQFKQSSADVLTKFITALNGVNAAGGSVTGTLEQLGLVNVRDIRVLGTLASSGYGQLENAIITVQDAAGALQREFETASGKLVNQTGRIGIAWDNLVLTIENGTGVIGKSTVAVVGFFADILEKANELGGSNSLKEFFTRFTSGSVLVGKALAKARGDLVRFEEDQKRLSKSDPFAFKLGNFQRSPRGVQTILLKENKELLETLKEKSRIENDSSKKTISNIAQQIKLVKDLQEHYDSLTKKTAEAPVRTAEQIAAEAAETAKQIAAREAAARKLEATVAESNNRVALSATEDRGKELERIRIFYDKSEALAKNNGGKLATLQANRAAEIAAVNAKWDAKDLEDRQKVEDKLSKILADAGISRIRSRQQELDQNKAKYDALLAEYRNNAKGMEVVDEARRAATAAINAKWDAKETDVAIQYTRRLYESKTQLLVRQLNEETKRKEKALIGDNAALLRLQEDYFKKVEEISAVDRANKIELSFDGSPLSVEIAKIDSEINLLRENFEKGIGAETFREDIASFTAMKEQLTLLKTGVDGVASSFGNLFGDAIFNGADAFENLGKAFENVAKSMISGLVQIGVRYLINQAIGTSSIAATTAASTAAAQATAAAWSTAAALVSTATFGAAAVTGGLALAATVASSKALALTGFSTGGYTGGMGRDQVAGVVHGQEYVINAEATKKHRGLLASINSGTFNSPSRVGGAETVSNQTQVFIAEQRTEGSTLITIFERAKKEQGRYAN